MHILGRIKKECTKIQRAKDKHSRSQELEIMCDRDGGTNCKEIRLDR